MAGRACLGLRLGSRGGSVRSWRVAIMASTSHVMPIVGCPSCRQLWAELKEARREIDRLSEVVRAKARADAIEAWHERFPASDPAERQMQTARAALFADVIAERLVSDHA